MTNSNAPTDKQRAYALDLILKLTGREQERYKSKLREATTTKQMSLLIGELRRKVWNA